MRAVRRNSGLWEAPRLGVICMRQLLVLLRIAPGALRGLLLLTQPSIPVYGVNWLRRPMAYTVTLWSNPCRGDEPRRRFRFTCS